MVEFCHFSKKSLSEVFFFKIAYLKKYLQIYFFDYLLKKVIANFKVNFLVLRYYRAIIDIKQLLKLNNIYISRKKIMQL